MNTTKKIVVALAVMMVAAMAAPAAMGADVGYSATVGAGQNTVLTEGTGGYGFETVSSPSADNKIDDTFKLNNNGNKAAAVNAKFTTNVGATFGLTKGATDVIGGSNFSLKAVDGGTENALNDEGTDVLLSYQVPADGNDHSYDAWLDVPALMPDGTYNGDIRLTFSTV